MTKHERDFTADFVPESPPIDAAEVTVPTPEPTELNPNFDVAQVATRGHVIVARTEKLSRIGFWPALALGVIAGIGVFRASSVPNYVMPPRFIAEALTYDETMYFDLGGGLRGPSALAFMADYAPTPESLPAADYDALTAALRTDLEAHGIEIDKWEAVGALKTAPKVTSPRRLLSEFSGRLKDGAIVVDTENEMVSVAAYVGGQWAVTAFSRRGCETVVGPVAKGCDDGTRKDGWTNQAVRLLSTYKPTAKE